MILIYPCPTAPAKLVQLKTSAGKKRACHAKAKMGHRLCRINEAVADFSWNLSHRNHSNLDSPRSYVSLHLFSYHPSSLIISFSLLFNSSSIHSIHFFKTSWRLLHPFGHGNLGYETREANHQAQDHLWSTKEPGRRSEPMTICNSELLAMNAPEKVYHTVILKIPRMASVVDRTQQARMARWRSDPMLGQAALKPNRPAKFSSKIW